MKGRKPTPTPLRLLRGNPSGRRFNHDEPVPEGLSTDAPNELSTDLARDEWRRTIVPAILRGQVTSADRVMAIAHCEVFAVWHDQLQEANRHPHVIGVGPNRHPMPNPARGMAHRSLLLLARVDAELGLTPSSRSRVKVDKARAPNNVSAIELFRRQRRGPR